MDTLVARQPIFDRRKLVYGYELLYRSPASENRFDGTEATSATQQVMSTTLLGIGLKDLLGGKKAFLNFDHRLLSGGLYLTLPPETAVIEILETVEPTADLISLCRSIQEQGYTIALDDFVYSPPFDALIDLARLIKVDLRITSQAEQKRLIRAYQPRGIAMLAEKVETQAEFDWALSAGYDYFQGYFFARPSVIRTQQVPASKLTCLRLLSELQKTELDFERVEALIRSDVALAYKLFRYVNSALYSRRGEIQSIRQALMIVGDANIRHWVALATLPLLTADKPGELWTLSLLRARFSEQLIALAGLELRNEAFLMGLFSLLDALLDRPLHEALVSVSVSRDITQALLGTAADGDVLSKIHQLTRCYEMGNWDEVEELSKACGFPAAAAGNAYVEAARWAEQMLQVVAG